jgi:hypothetical protein
VTRGAILAIAMLIAAAMLPGAACAAHAAPSFTRMSADDAKAQALAQPDLATARRIRPDSTVRVRYLSESARWRVSVRARTNAQTLALIEIDDVSGEIVRGVTLPLGDYPPRHTEREAIDAAVEDAGVRERAKMWGGVKTLRAAGDLDGCCWQVDLFDPDRADGDSARPVIRVDVTDASLQVTGVWTGIQIPWKMARGEREAFGGDINRPAIWYALCALFALVVIDWRRVRSLANADAIALLSFAASYDAFVRGNIDWSVPLGALPLVWIALRMGWLYARGVPAPTPPRTPRTRLGSFVLRPVPTIALVVLCVAVAGLRIGLTTYGGNVIDVGYAGVTGARLELAGTAPWGNMPADIERGDTYGPANYLAYVPAVALLDDGDGDAFGSRLPAAQATSIAADLGCALLLVLIGWRWITRRAGVLLALGWLACPWTTLVLASGANDALVALALLGAFAAVPRPWLRGLLVGVATMVKLAPIVALAPLLHVGSRRRLRQASWTTLGFMIAIAAGIAWAVLRLDGTIAHDLQLLWERTVQFQATRDSPFSPWGLYGWDTAQQLLRLAVVAAVLGACVRPRARDAWQTAAGISALLAAVQLAADHWFYLYIPWLVPFVLLVLVARRERPAVSPQPGATTVRSIEAR